MTSDRLAFWWKLALFGMVFSVVLYRVSHTGADPDLWGHVRFGLDMLRDGTIHTVDPYSYLSDQGWINHEWLTELILAQIFTLGGAQGLIVFKTLISLLMFGLLYRHLCNHGFSLFRGGMVVVLALYPILIGLVMVRPHLFTYLGFLLTLMALKAAEEGKVSALWSLPPLFLVWTNLHGGFLAGGGICAIWLAAFLAEKAFRSDSDWKLRRIGWAKVAVPIGAAGLATFVNPYGIGLLTFLARTATVRRPEIVEWDPLNISSREGGYYLALVALALFACWQTRKRLPLTTIAPFVSMAILPLLAFRHLPLFVFAFAVLMGEHLADALSRLWSQDKIGGAGDKLRAPFIAACAIAAVALIVKAVPNFRCIEFDLIPIPVQQVAWLKSSGVKGNLAVFFNWGEYVIWHLGPDIKVSIDGRRETVYSDEIRDENLEFTFGRPTWDALLERRPADFALVSKKTPAYSLLRLKPGWELLQEDSLSAVFARQDSPQREILAETPMPDLSGDERSRCFP